MLTLITSAFLWIVSAGQSSWTWSPELSSVKWENDSLLFVQYVIRIQAPKDDVFHSLEPATPKSSELVRGCDRCQPYVADSVIVSAVDSQGKVLGKGVTLFGYIMPIRKNEVLVFLQSTKLSFRRSKISSLRFAYRNNSLTPVFNSAKVRPHKDFSQWFTPMEIPYTELEDSP